MSRAQFQVLVLPFRRLSSGELQFCALRRTDDGKWQGVAGGGEGDETPEQAAIRETQEELGTPPSALFYRLDSVSSIPSCHFAARKSWPRELLVIPEYSFGVDCSAAELALSDEHVAQAWGSFEETHARLSWDSNRTALWELNERLLSKLLRAPISQSLT